MRRYTASSTNEHALDFARPATERETDMDMSVRVGAAAEPQPAKAEPRKAMGGANASGLDAWLEKVEALGELKRITAEVDPDLEAATITYLVGGEKSGSTSAVMRLSSPSASTFSSQASRPL